MDKYKGDVESKYVDIAISLAWLCNYTSQLQYDKLLYKIERAWLARLQWLIHNITYMDQPL